MAEDPPKPKPQGSVPPPPPPGARSSASAPPPPPASMPPGSVPPPPPFKPATQPFHPEMIAHDPGVAPKVSPQANPKMTMQGHVAPQLASDTLPTTDQPFPAAAPLGFEPAPFEGDEFEGAATAASLASQPVLQTAPDPIALPQTGAATAFTAAMEGFSSDVVKDTLRGFTDFSFTKRIAPRLVKVLYAFFIFDAIAALLTLWYGAAMSLVHGSIAGAFGGFIMAPVAAIVIIGLGRIICEWMTVGFRSAENLEVIRAALTDESDG